MTWHDTIRRVCREKVRNVHDPVLSLSLFLFHSFRNCPSYIRHRYNTIQCTTMLVDADQKWTEQSLRLTSIESYHIISNTVQYNTTQYNLPMTNYRTALYRTEPHRTTADWSIYHIMQRRPSTCSCFFSCSCSYPGDMYMMLSSRWYSQHSFCVFFIFFDVPCRTTAYHTIPYCTTFRFAVHCIALFRVASTLLDCTRLASPVSLRFDLIWFGLAWPSFLWMGFRLIQYGLIFTSLAWVGLT